MKKVNFKKISIINFLSVGDDPVTVEFNKGLHVIKGKNNTVKIILIELFERNGGFNRKRLDKDCALCYNNAILTW